jgi:parvulin-like peptidyl-prolyl isomerase
MSGKDMFANSLGWRVWKYRFFTVGCFVFAAAICLVLKQFVGTPESQAQSPRSPNNPVNQQPAGQQRPPQGRQQQNGQANGQGVFNQVQPGQTLNILAIVNGEQLTRQQLADECLKRHGGDVIERLVNRQLILSECQRQGIQISPQEIEQEVQKVAQKFGIPADRYLAMLESRKNVTAEQYKREIIWPTLALRRLARDKIVVNPQEVQREMEIEIGPRTQVRLIALNDAATANQVWQQARQNPEAFGTLAKDFSVDANSAATRGMVPPIRLHIGDPHLEKVAFSLQEGQVSEVIELANQFLILKCEKHFPSQIEELDQQQRQLFEQRIIDQLSEKKLASAAQELFVDLQNRTKVVNVYNNPDLREQNPGVAAMIGNTQVTIHDLAEECIARHGSEVLEGEINRLLLSQQLKQANLSVQKPDTDSEILRAADAYGMLKEDGSPDIEKWLTYITQEGGMSVETYVNDVIWPTVALKKLVEKQVQVSEEDLQKGFEANFGERVEVLAVVLSNQKQAQEVWNLANQNSTEEYFGNLANAYSIEPASKANFGRVPPIQKFGGRPAMEEEAFRLKPGELSGIVNIGENWIVLKCVGRTSPRVRPEDFNQVRDELHKDIHEKKMRVAMAEHFDRVRAASQIDNYLVGTSQMGAQQQARSAEVQNRLPFQAQRQQ